MKVLHVISSIDISKGGPSKSVSDLGTHLAQKDVQIQIITTKSHLPYLSVSQSQNLKVKFINNLSWGKTLKKYCQPDITDILHGHALWQMPVHRMSKWARNKNIPYIISPRGMLEPWALNSGKLKKQIALALYQRNDLAKACCLHATSVMEFENIRNLGFRNPVAVIPNGIDLSEVSSYHLKQRNGKNNLLFLSRIHPKKGIELLIQAWSEIDKEKRRNWQVNIAGNGEVAYIMDLKEQIRQRGLENEIRIVGPKFGAEKSELFRSADLFILPTYSENFGVVVAEALASGVPVITTRGAPWEEINSHNAGWCIDIGLDPLVITLQKAMSLSPGERNLMGQNGRKLIEENYSIELVTTKMIQLYNWILLGGQKPEFVSI